MSINQFNMTVMAAAN